MEEYMTILGAAEYLGVSRDKVSRLIRAGKLTTIENQLDSRSRLIAKVQLDTLKPGRIIGATVKRDQAA